MLETPTHMNQDTVTRLNKLIQINLDSSEGFEEAAKDIEDPSLRTMFVERSRERLTFANELKPFVSWNDKEPKDRGSLRGAMHRLWLDLRAKISGNEPAAVLAEAERGEDAIKNMYEDVIKDTSGSPVNDLLHRQYAKVKATHDHIRDLRDAAKTK